MTSRSTRHYSNRRTPRRVKAMCAHHVALIDHLLDKVHHTQHAARRLVPVQPQRQHLDVVGHVQPEGDVGKVHVGKIGHNQRDDGLASRGREEREQAENASPMALIHMNEFAQIFRLRRCN